MTKNLIRSDLTQGDDFNAGMLRHTIRSALSHKRPRPCENSGINGRRADETVHLLKKSGYISCMQHIQGGDRNQTLLLPGAVDDYVGRKNPVRFIEAFVDQCDLQEAGFSAFSRRTRADRATILRICLSSTFMDTSIGCARQRLEQRPHAIWK